MRRSTRSSTAVVPVFAASELGPGQRSPAQATVPRQAGKPGEHRGALGGRVLPRSCVSCGAVGKTGLVAVTRSTRLSLLTKMAPSSPPLFELCAVLLFAPRFWVHVMSFSRACVLRPGFRSRLPCLSSLSVVSPLSFASAVDNPSASLSLSLPLMSLFTNLVRLSPILCAKLSARVTCGNQPMHCA
ncbi:hypothetical protein BJV78DRAFT_779612 [Lactifluus subvellereus]|nr:hypothetical protein BJV78DRAFT_779612 [Lactifluus subvellereus]